MLKHGTIMYNTSVTQIQKVDDTEAYKVAIKGATFKTKSIVSAAGPYTGELLRQHAPYLDSLINPQRVFLAFLKIKPSTYAALAENQKKKLLDYYPVINSSKGTRSGSFFSMIEYYDEHDHPVIKIGGHFQRSNIDKLDKVWQQELEQSEIEWSINSTADYIKLLNIPITKSDLVFDHGYSCVYSLTDTEVPLVTPLIGEGKNPDNNFVAMCGMSGVGAKGAMTYGLIASNIILNKTEKDTSFNTVTKALGYERLLEDVYE